MMDDFRPQRPGQPTDKPDDLQPAYNERPETYEALPDAQATPEPTEPSPKTPKKKSGVKKWLLGGIVVLLLAGLGAVAYWQWSEADSAKKELSSAQSQLETTQADLAKADAGSNTGIDEPVAGTPTDTIQSRADDMVKAIKAAHLNVDYVSKLDKVKGDYVGVITGMPNKDGLEVIFKNTTNGLVQIAIYDGMAGMSKNEAATLKSDYGFDAAAFGLTVNP